MVLEGYFKPAFIVDYSAVCMGSFHLIPCDKVEAFAYISIVWGTTSVQGRFDQVCVFHFLNDFTGSGCLHRMSMK